MINGSQKVKLEKRFIEFKNYNRQIPNPFKIYADFKCLLKMLILELMMILLVILPNIKTMFPVVFAYKLVCLNDKFSKDIVFSRGKNAVFKFIQCIFKECDYSREVRGKHFNNNLVMTAEQNEEFERIFVEFVAN